MYRAKENECADQCASELGPSAQQHEIQRCTTECISPECYKYYYVEYEVRFDGIISLDLTNKHSLKKVR